MMCRFASHQSATAWRIARLRASRTLLLAFSALFMASAVALGAQATSGVSGRVTDRESGEALAGVRVGVFGSSAAVATRADGSFRLPLEPGRHELRLTFIGYTMVRDTVTVSAGEMVSRAYALPRAHVNLDQVVVLGSRRPDRTVLEAPVPIDVLTSEEIRSTGLTETSQVIQLLAPSFNFPRTSISDGTDHIRPSTLRGLGPDQVLVLVNGKRRHTSSLVNVNGTIGRGSTGVDLNAIPTSAIERVEILRDGAAAQYGSDAIAGVINIILKEDQGGTASVTTGQTKVGDGLVRQADLNLGFPLLGRGFIHATGEFRDREGTNRSRPDTRQQYFAGDPRNSDPALTNRVNHWQGDSEVRDLGGFVNASAPLANGMELYAFGGYTRRDGRAAGFFRRPNDDRTVRAIHPNGFLPIIESDISDKSMAGGVKGRVMGWSYDASAVWGANLFDFFVKNSNNVSMGTASPTEFYAGQLRFSQGTANLDIVRAVEVGLASPIGVAIGAEYRRDRYIIVPGEPASYNDGGVRILDGPNAGGLAALGAQVFPGFRPSDATDQTRSNVAGYVDVEANITRMLLIGLAGRAENYSDFGSTTNGKVALRFEPVTGVAFRGAASTGFRAPSLGQSWFSSTATNFINGVPNDIRTFPVSTREAQILGASPLEPENSVNLSAGVTLKPSTSFSISADLYSVEIEDRIVFSGNFIGDSVRSLLVNQGITGVAGGRYFTNAIDTRTRGLDVVMNYGVRTSATGLLRLTGGYNTNRTKVTHVDSTPPALRGFQETLFDRVERGRIEEGQPRNSITLTGNYTVAGFGASLTNRRYGKVTSRGTTRSLDQVFWPKWITDASVSYRVAGRASVTAGGTNIFDVYPDENIPANSFSGILPYTGITPFGFNGAYYYVRAAFDFDPLGLPGIRSVRK